MKTFKTVHYSKGNYYICEKHGCIWSGEVSDMRPDYQYGIYTYFFETEQEANTALQYAQKNGGFSEEEAKEMIEKQY
jgi:hypothetical protein